MAEASTGPLDRKAIFGWAMFDFANSSFTTVMVTAYFSIFFQKVVVGPGPEGSLDRGSFFWGIAQGISQAVVILSAPLVGALADFTGAKKKFLMATYLGCSLLTLTLRWVGPGDIMLAMFLFVIANVCYSSGENIVGAFLPDVAPPNLMGFISGLAWGLGYIGGIGSLLLALVILNVLGEDRGYPWVWVMIGLWFLLAGLPTFIFVKERHKHEAMPAGQTLATVGFHRLAQTIGQAQRFRQLFRFLLVFTVISTGLTAVIAFASIIATETLHFDTQQLGIFLIWSNLVAVLGAWFWGWLQDKIGSRWAIQLSLVSWLVALVLVIFIKPVGNHETASGIAKLAFWTAGAFVGIGMGATSSSCRALVGIFSPQDRSGEFFGLWGLAGKLGSVVGPFAFGSVKFLSSDIRVAEGVMGGFFVLSFFLMWLIDEKEGRSAAQISVAS